MPRRRRRCRYEHETALGADAIAAAGGLAPATAVAEPPVPQQVVNDETQNIGRNDPCWCGSGQEVQALPWRVGPSRRGGGTSSMAVQENQPLPQLLEELGAQLDWVREYL